MDQVQIWGLTGSQTLTIVLFAVGVLFALGLLQFVFRLGQFFMRCGCMFLSLAILAIVFLFILHNIGG